MIQFGPGGGELLAVLVQLGGFAVASFGVTAAAAAAYRWYFAERLGEGIGVLAGVGTVAIYLNTTGLFGDAIGGTPSLFDPTTVAFNVLALVVGAVAAAPGRVAGDRLTTDVFAVTGRSQLDAGVGRLARTVGRLRSVQLPDDIEDMPGYDPVDPAVKTELAGKTLVFPARLTIPELRDRLVTRLKADHDVGYVDVVLADEGDVEYLALGGRQTGIGPRLGPGTCAVAIRADPAPSASAGDVVQVWRTDAAPERVATGELRGTAGDVATVVVDEDDAQKLDAETEYRLVTLRAEPRADREFASLLRAADETMAAVTVASDSPLLDRPLSALEVTVVALRPADGEVVALPDKSLSPSPGDTLYAVARPEALRRLEAAAEGAGNGGSEA